MNIGLLLPAAKKRWKPLSVKAYTIEVAEDLGFVVCLLPYAGSGAFSPPGNIKRVKSKLDRIFEDHSTWSVLEHPKLQGLYQNNLNFVAEAVRAISTERFCEVLKIVKGLGALDNKEILITGLPSYLEYAIEKLITRVKTINVLIPEDMEAPAEAEKAFLETGIPVHITNDKDVLSRNKIWLRFPGDHESFDTLPQKFKGIIVDLGALKIIDTKLRKIFSIHIEFSDRIKRRLGQQLLSTWEKGVLEGFVAAMCAESWKMSVTEASIRLGIRISFNS